MARNFRELEAKLPPEARVRAKARAKEMMVEVRKTMGLSQEQIDALLDSEQPTRANAKKISGD